NELPVANAPHWLLAAVVERQPPVVRRKSTEGGTNRGFIELLLTTIDPDASYTTWFAIGWALFSALGDENGEEVWGQWSSNGRKYKPREIARKWRGIIEDDGYNHTIATIHYFADHEAVDAALFARLKQGYANAARTREELFGDQS